MKCPMKSHSNIFIKQFSQNNGTHPFMLNYNSYNDNNNRVYRFMLPGDVNSNDLNVEIVSQDTHKLVLNLNINFEIDNNVVSNSLRQELLLTDANDLDLNSVECYIENSYLYINFTITHSSSRTNIPVNRTTYLNPSANSNTNSSTNSNTNSSTNSNTNFSTSSTQIPSTNSNTNSSTNSNTNSSTSSTANSSTTTQTHQVDS